MKIFILWIRLLHWILFRLLSIDDIMPDGIQLVIPFQEKEKTPIKDTIILYIIGIKILYKIHSHEKIFNNKINPILYKSTTKIQS